MKICNKCKVEKELYEFTKHNSSPDGLKYTCKECVKKYRAPIYEGQKVVKKIKPLILSIAHKICIKCNENKTIDSFGNEKNNKDGLRNKCKSCVTEEMYKKMVLQPFIG